MFVAVRRESLRSRSNTIKFAFIFIPLAMADSSVSLPRSKAILSSSTGFSTELSAPAGPAMTTSVIPQKPALVAITAQKGLTESQAAGIKAVEHILAANNGGLFSGAHPPPLPPHSESNPEPPLGPSSSTRPITRSATAPTLSPQKATASTGAVPEGLSPLPTATALDPPAKITAFEHFKMTSVAHITTAKPIAERTSSNLVILADVVRGLESQVQKTTRDVTNLTTEVRLRPRSLSPASPIVTWGNLYGVSVSRQGSPCSRRRTRSRTRSERSRSGPKSYDSELQGRMEELEFQTDQSRNHLNVRILALERRESDIPPVSSITADDLQKATVQRFSAVTQDLDVLNEGLYALGKDHDRATAMLVERVNKLEEGNRHLRDENESHRTTLKELQAAIRRLEIVSAPPLIMRPRSPQRLAHSHTVPQPRQSRSPPPFHHQSRMAPRARSRSPPTKRARTDELNGFISLGPLAESAELPQKHFELHLRTAIPAFCLKAPYTVQNDPSFPGHLRVTVASPVVARSLIDAWRKKHRRRLYKYQNNRDHCCNWKTTGRKRFQYPDTQWVQRAREWFWKIHFNGKSRCSVLGIEPTLTQL
ncbi:hypothetical protein C8J57DRAFT_1236933 [Mycena rebaudengoi]|nr:hypothetical protein C8J57DRAFT_1236933 [Mycena rebaudengoi]